ncbi:MAG: ribosome biogenesis GTP-binding protein YihA/YsxC [Alphaproteobacteria bacterium]|nr:ribosome biogenesis GTP-binding protein YihA/YsxC [Alphaproteobacteria bacterium]
MTAEPGDPSRSAALDTIIADEPDAEALEAGRLLFAKECTFLRGVVRLDGLPEPRLPEIAFAGRSNVGKSSLMNALTGRKTLARTSNTPGRTREINFFELGGALLLADLPGYGYAKAPKTQIKGWNRLVRDYLTGRPNLRRLCLLIDARRGIKDSDREIMALLDEAAVVYQTVFTKCDKVKAGALAARLEEANAELKTHGAAYPTIAATSALKGTGIDELRAGLAALAA